MPEWTILAIGWAAGFLAGVGVHYIIEWTYEAMGWEKKWLKK